MTRLNVSAIARIGCLAATLCFIPIAQAKKPEKPPGGGNGGGTSAFTIIPFRPANFATTESYVPDLNEQGQAVGVVGLPSGNAVAVHLDVTTNIYTTLLDNARAEGVNNLNQIVGTEYIGDGRAVFWSAPSAAPMILQALPGDATSQAWAINDAGIIVGASWSPKSPPPANEDFATGVVWRVFLNSAGDVQVDGPVSLGPLTGGSESFAVDVTEVIGSSALVTGETWFGGNLVKEAVVWNVSLNADGTLAAPGPPTGLGTLGEQNPSGSFSTAINNFGDACGESDGRPVIAPAGQNVQPLSLPRGTIWGRAEDVNDPGEVVGRLRLKQYKHDTVGLLRRAYLWRDGNAIDLETQIDRSSGWDALWSANVINNSGVIAGWRRFDVKSRGYLLIPNNP
jgi:uncharacterized membrane protein